MDDEESCPFCGSRAIHPSEGRLFCSNGHDLGPAPAVAEEERDYAERGKIVRRKEQRVKQKVSKIYRGRKGYRLFLLAWQYVLWKQCYAAVHVGGLPGELWRVVRDLWALRLESLAVRFEDVKGVSEREGTDGERDDVTSDGLSETTDSGSEDAERRATKSMQTARCSPRLIDTIALLYIGLLLLRYPLRLSILYQWLKTETVPFIRAIRFVPEDIKKHLSSEYHHSLDTIALPGLEDVQTAILRLAVIYGTTFGMVIPPLNSTPLLLSHIEHLALPLQVYDMVKKLNKIVEYDFAYHAIRHSRRQPTTYPEAQLMSLVVVATKLLFPFDSHSLKRYPKSSDGPGALRVDWSKWLEAKQKFDEIASLAYEEAMKAGAEIAVKEIDMMEMSDDQLDQYMDWYQRTFARIEGRDEENVGREILEMFPVKHLPVLTLEDLAEKERDRNIVLDELRDERLSAVLGTMKSRKMISEENAARLLTEQGSYVMRPGLEYQSFRDVRALEGAAKVFYTEAAELACLSVEQLLRAVNHTEQKIEKWKMMKKRSQMFGDGMGVEFEDEVIETV